MASPAQKIQTFLLLPREVRLLIIGEILFPGEKEPEEFSQNTMGLAATAVRQIFPYDKNEHRKPRFDVAIIRTCRQLQLEAEEVLYGTSSFNLMYQDWYDRTKLSYEFFQALPTRLRKLVRRVERKCYSAHYGATISLYDWTLFMTFLARECPKLTSLKLWGPGDRQEGPGWVETCKKDAEWVQAVLQIKSLTYFDIPVIRNGVIYNYPEFTDEFLPWLKSCLQHKSSPCHAPLQPLEGPYDASALSHRSRFPFLGLPISVRVRVYRHVLLPPNKEVHPYIKSWYDQTTQNAMPLFLACKMIRSEAERVLYTEAVFTSSILKYDLYLQGFLEGRTGPWGPGLSERLLHYIGQVRVSNGDTSYARFMDGKTTFVKKPYRPIERAVIT